MIISRTPLRISFFGGGSDIASFYKKHPAAVVSTAINKYIYIAVKKQFDGRIIVSYSKTETVKQVKDIENNLVRETMKLTGVTGGIHITSISDIPSEGSGLGSSSSYTVGLLNALYAYQGKYVNAERLAKEASQIEIDILQKPIGKQDQYIAAYGGLQYIQFNKDGSVFVDPIICLPEKKKRLEKKLLLFYTGITRSADTILAQQTKNMATQIQKQKIMQEMVAIATEMRDILNSNKLHAFGEKLDRNWMLKKKMAGGVSTKKIDTWYEIAKKHGALGGKLLGAGGGGFLLFYAPENKHRDIIRFLPDLIHQEVRLEPQGSKIIFVGD